MLLVVLLGSATDNMVFAATHIVTYLGYACENQEVCVGWNMLYGGMEGI